MSRTASTGLKNHLAGEVTTLAYLWKVVRSDGVTFGFTDHDADITFEGLIYAAATGFNATAISTSAALNVDNLDVEAAFDSSAITEADLMAGLWDNAAVYVYLVNWADLTQGAMKLRRGWLGIVKTDTRGQFSVELRGLMQRLQQSIGEVYSPNCRADLGDARCKIDLVPLTYDCEVTGVTDRRVFASNALTPTDGVFDFGRLTWLTGLNAGLQMEVKTSYLGGSIGLQLPMPHDIAAGDTFRIVAGCDKTWNTCRTRYNNALNFRGEPHLPGIDRILLYGKNGTT